MLDADREAIEQAVRKVIDADYDRIMRRIHKLEERVAELEREKAMREPYKSNKERSL